VAYVSLFTQPTNKTSARHLARISYQVVRNEPCKLESERFFQLMAVSLKFGLWHTHLNIFIRVLKEKNANQDDLLHSVALLLFSFILSIIVFAGVSAI